MAAEADCRHLAGLYLRAAERYGPLPAFATRLDKQRWQPTSFQELVERGRNLATGLIALGLEPRGHLGLFADNRLEWVVSDCATHFAAATNVPRGSDVTDRELGFILVHAGIRLAIVENAVLEQRVHQIAAEKGIAVRTVLLCGEPAVLGSCTLAAVEADGGRRRSEGDREVEGRIESLSPDDLFTLIYTSGTTGRPKGVMLTHANMLSQIRNIPLALTWRDRVLSLLPIWHVYERVFEMMTIRAGACTYYSSVRHLADDMLAVEPTFMGSAPRLWETLHDRILKNVRHSHPVRRGLFAIAHWLSRYYHRSLFYLKGFDFREHPPIARQRWCGYILHGCIWFVLLPWYGFFNVAVLERIRQVAGGSMKGTISGGGALPEHIDAFFNNMGITVLEGYGLTETSPVLAVRTLQNRVMGTVGPLIPETALRIVALESGDILYPDPADPNLGRMRKGEILVRGPQVMKGYYKDRVMTETVLQDGWFRTGDLGLVNGNDCLKILGRCKETVVLSSGENVEPGPIESLLRQSPFIENCMVVGQDQRHLGLLVVPSLDADADGALTADVSADAAYLAQLEAEVGRLIHPQNGFKPYERIRAIRVVPEPFRVGEELTSLFKLRRHVIEAKYQDVLAEMFHVQGKKWK
jgi:long-chain acyl-CoA synthetase